MHNYLYFRTGSIAFEDFAEDSGHVLEELSRYTEDNEWKLYRMHFFLMEERKEEGKELLELLEKVSQRDEFTPLEAELFFIFKGNVLQNTGGDQQSSIYDKGVL